jgi:alpha-glucosidase
MYDALRFWLDRGVDGFRVDVIWHLIKDDQLRDNPPNPAYESNRPDIERYLQLYSADQDDVHQVVEELRAVLDRYDERVLIGEIYLPLERLMAYYGRDLRGAHLPFNFQLIHAQWDARHIRGLIADYERAIPAGGWPNWVLGNHDKPRIASRVGPAQARVAAMMLLTLRGTPTLYYGDELGMEQVPIGAGDVHDPWEKNEPGLGLGRDPERTPMQWDGSEGAGFSHAKPWLPLAADWRTRNVETARADPNSLLALYRRLIDLRRSSPALSVGSYRAVETNSRLLVFDRICGDERLRVALNLGPEPDELDLGRERGRILVSARRGAEGNLAARRLVVGGDDGLIIRLE